MDVPTFRRILPILLRRSRPQNWTESLDPFEALVSIIVSQNSTDLVTGRVMADLASRARGGARSIAAMRARDLVRAPRPAGLARQKVPKIKKTARILVDDFDGAMDA